MQIRIIIGANAYCNIKTKSINMDIKLSPGKSAAASLLETAEEWHEQAKRLTRNAVLAKLAAKKITDSSVS